MYTIAIYLAPLIIIWAVFLIRNRLKLRSASAKMQEAIASGMTEPASLHPVIDPAKCLGCGTCVKACPEGDILGLIHGKAKLVMPANCIGHGACKTACPFDAITLVFGTETRGVDIPVLKPNFETNVPGIFIAGELGGMGLIRNAVEQGKQAVTEICRTLNKTSDTHLDLLIIGAGPAGIAASLAAKQLNLKFKTIDQDSLGGTVSHFPRNKIVMTAPVELPIIGKVSIRETTKEALLEFWQKAIDKAGLNISFGERLENIETLNDYFKVITTTGQYTTRRLLLCLGRRGTPRTLGVKGEDLPKVVYRLIDPAQYRNQHVLVVGGGDSALEAAVSIADEPGTKVTLSYRSESFSRAKPKNRDKVAKAEQARKIQVLMKSEVTEIKTGEVVIAKDNKTYQLENDNVIVCAGGILPTPFLEKIGISIETKYGTA